MQTKCPHCKADCDYFKDKPSQLISCWNCSTQFIGRPVTGEFASKDYIDQSVSNDKPRLPGSFFYVMAVAIILISFFWSLCIHTFVYLILGILAGLIFFAIGVALNQLERIAHHIELMCSEFRKQNEINVKEDSHAS